MRQDSGKSGLAILTAALPLGDFLDSKHFRCTVPEYQRGYEWKPTTHTRKVLDDLLYAFSQRQPVALLGNAILQQYEEEQDNGKADPSAGWWEGRARYCDVVDGQQRLTTLVMLYAVIQERLFLEDPTTSASQIKNLGDRFGAIDRQQAGPVSDHTVAQLCLMVQLQDRANTKATENQRQNWRP